MEFYFGIGIMVFVVVYLVVLMQDTDKDKIDDCLKQLQAKFGEEIGLKVYKGVVDVGMTEAMVIAAKGKPSSQITEQKVGGKTMEFTYLSKNEEGKVVSTQTINFEDGKVSKIRTKK